MNVFETAGNTKKTETKWIFRNATLEWPTKKPGEKLISPVFHAVADEEVKWSIQVYPNGYTDEEKDYISMYLHLTKCPSTTSSIVAKCSCTLQDEESQMNFHKVNLIFNSNTFTCINGTAPQGWGWPKVIKQADVLKRNVFSITCKLEYWDPITATNTTVLPNSSIPLSSEESSLNQDLEKLFTNRSGTDVCFIVDGKEIQAHKAILSARSPVFAAMLESGMKETVSNRVEIKDIAPDIFKALLRSIYTDRVDLTKVDTKDLLAAANKYLLPLLKFQCQIHLAGNITKGSCVELLVLADLHNAVHLKKSTVSFIRANRTEVMKIESWKNLKQSRPDLAFDVLENL